MYYANFKTTLDKQLFTIKPKAMKRKLTLFIILVFFGNLVFATGEISDYYLQIFSPNNPSGKWYGNQSGNTPLDGEVIDNNIILNSSSLYIQTRGINTLQSEGCIFNSARMNYRVYKQGTSAPSFTTVNLPFVLQADGKKEWHESSPVINLLNGITTTGTYVFEVYFDASTNCTDCACAHYYSNFSNNFKATFIVTGTLPLNLLYFDAINLGNKQIKLTWASNVDNHADVFEIQYSKNGVHYHAIGEINSYGSDKYEFIHNNPVPGVAYYRLKQTDRDGLITYSNIRVVELLENQIKISPNPATKTLSIRGLDNTGQIISIIDQNGKELYRGTTNSDYFEVDIESFQPGIYFVKIQNSLDIQSFRFIKS